MSSPNPISPYGKSGNYIDEVSTSGDINALLRFFASKKLRNSLSSPPLLKDVPEGEMILDKTALRIYVTVDNTLRYFELT